MLTLCLCSTDSGAGKTAHAVALGRRFQRDHLSVEYLLTVTSPGAGPGERSVPAFIRRALNLGEPRDRIFPVSLHAALETFSGEITYTERLRTVAADVGAGRDVLILETGDSIVDGSLIGLGVPDVVRVLNAPTLIVARYTGEGVVDAILAARWAIGAPVIGAVITGIPVPQMEYATRTLRPALERRGVRVLGAYPSDRMLAAVTVRELVTELGGTFLSGEDAAEELVERLMVGAMTADHAASYFRRQANKAVITGGDRPSIQLAALETPTRCLILTGQFSPDPAVLARAQELGIPVVTVPLDTLSAVERSQEVFSQSRFQQEKKIARFVELVNRHFDVAALYSALGLRPRPNSGS